MELREEFVHAWYRDEMSMTELCRVYGISRKTGYKWVERFEQSGRPGLVDRCRAPKTHPHAVSDEMAELVIGLRKRHPTWGARKLKVVLEREHPRLEVPAASTIGELLKRHGLVLPRKRRPKTPRYVDDLVEYESPNQVWCADFKGDVPLAKGGKVCPLTITDGYSRYLLRCQSVPRMNTKYVKKVFESAFREFGLPSHIRTDNGTPFASRGLGGLSRLAIWWMKLGITHERIEPGKPQQNGRHERMHKTLKADACRLPRVGPRKQQRRFDEFRHVYNDLRPHAALDMQTPASVYERSPREYPTRLLEIRYPHGTTLRKVKQSGWIKWKGEELFVSRVLAGEYLGLSPLPDGGWQINYGKIQLGCLRADGTLELPKDLRASRRS